MFKNKFFLAMAFCLSTGLVQATTLEENEAIAQVEINKAQVSSALRTASFVAAPASLLIFRFFCQTLINKILNGNLPNLTIEQIKSIQTLAYLAPYGLTIASRNTDIANSNSPHRANKDSAFINVLKIFGIQTISEIALEAFFPLRINLN